MLVELTIPFEFCFDDAAKRKEAVLVKDCEKQGWTTELITIDIEVGSRDSINKLGFKKLKRVLNAPKEEIMLIKEELY